MTESNNCCQGLEVSYCNFPLVFNGPQNDPIYSPHIYLTGNNSLLVSMRRVATRKTVTVSQASSLTYFNPCEGTPYLPPIATKADGTNITLFRGVAYQEGLQFIDDMGRTQVPFPLITCTPNTKMVWQKTGKLQYGITSDALGGKQANGSWNSSAKRNLFWGYETPATLTLTLEWKIVSGSTRDLFWEAVWSNFTPPSNALLQAPATAWPVPIGLTSTRVVPNLTFGSGGQGFRKYNNTTFSFCGDCSCSPNHWLLDAGGNPIYKQFQWDETAANFGVFFVNIPATSSPSTNTGQGCLPTTPCISSQGGAENKSIHEYYNYLDVRTAKIVEHCAALPCTSPA